MYQFLLLLLALTHLPSMTSRSDVGKVRRQSTIISRAGSFIIGVGAWEVVRELAGPLEHVAFLIWPISNLQYKVEA